MALFKNKYRVESARLRGWDYAAAGWYFVTICTQNRECFFGEVAAGEMRLSPVWEIAGQYWKDIPRHSSKNIGLDVFVIMPNHVHGIVVIEGKNVARGCRDVAHNCRDVACNVSTTTTTTTHKPMSRISPKSGSLGVVVRSYKSAVTRWCHVHHYPFFDWQPRFFDRVIRDETSLNKIRQYIVQNPVKWEEDRNNPANLWM